MGMGNGERGTGNEELKKRSYKLFQLLVVIHVDG